MQKGKKLTILCSFDTYFERKQVSFLKHVVM